MRGLVGTVPSEVLEDVMDAVARNSSEDVLRIVDRLLVEGQSAQHFARQMLRFLRNALVAKVAGSDSPVLQISADERARVARVAERFSEEDLARFMQIMLRTHGELGYKQEQRFHLELGLLKLVHAQRLLPLEELLSSEAGKSSVAGIGGAIRSGFDRRSRASGVETKCGVAIVERHWICRQRARPQFRHSANHRRSRRIAVARVGRRRRRIRASQLRLQLQWVAAMASPCTSGTMETANSDRCCGGSERQIRKRRD